MIERNVSNPDSGKAKEIVGRDLDEITANLAEFKPQIQDKTFLVSGGAGFLGSWFSEAALKMGGKVICVDNLIASTKANIDNLLSNPNYTFVNMDISRFKLPENIDYIVHMASIASPPLYQRYPIQTLDSGIMGIRKLLKYAKEHKVSGFLYTSTSEVYGNPPDELIPTSEDYNGNVSSYGPRAMYDESKRVGESYCYSYAKNDGVPIRIARIFNTYGPKLDVKQTSQYGRALIKFVNQAVNEEPITVYGDGSQTRSFCYVTDQITGLYKLLLTNGINGEVVNIGNNTETSVLQLAQEIVRISGSSSPVLIDTPPTYDLQHDPKRRVPNITKAKQLLDYNPTTLLEDGLKRTIDWTKAKLSI